MANRQEFERHLRPEDLLLVPPFPADMGILDWHRHTELMDRTYLWALHEPARPAAQHCCDSRPGKAYKGYALSGRGNSPSLLARRSARVACRVGKHGGPETSRSDRGWQPALGHR
jgi:hypothetical protein